VIGMDVNRAPREPVKGPAASFTGEVTLDQLAVPGEPARVRVGHVRFAPGARTAWHRHPFGQVLFVTEGSGLVQARGGPVESISAGDTVRTAPDEWHWHGAGPTTALAHIAIQESTPDGVTAIWGEHVTDGEYGG
jgi:quercetin dioxygenase-like cupin family protein